MPGGLLCQGDSTQDEIYDEEEEESSENADEYILAQQENNPVFQRIAQGKQGICAATALLSEIQEEAESQRVSKARGKRTSARSSNTKGRRKRKTTSRNTHKIDRIDSITGEPTKEFMKKWANTWKVKKIKRDRARKGMRILEDAASLDTCVVESLVYFEHTFDLSAEKEESFQKNLMKRWLQAHPDRSLLYVDANHDIATYNTTSSWKSMSWNQPTAWILDTSNLLEDDTLWVLRMMDEINIEPYAKLMESIKYS